MKTRGQHQLILGHGLALLVVALALASCDSLTRFSRSAKLSGVADQGCVTTAIQSLAHSRGHFEPFATDPSALDRARQPAPGMVFVPAQTSHVLPFSVTVIESGNSSELHQTFSDIGPEHSRASIVETLAFMTEIETAVAGECHVEVQTPVAQDCLAHQCPSSPDSGVAARYAAFGIHP